MAFEIGSVSYSTTGNKTISLANVTSPKSVRFRIGAKSSDTANHWCLGEFDGSTNTCTSGFTDGTGSATYKTNTEAFAHYERQGGVITKILSGTVVSFGTTDFTINVATAGTNAVNYPIYFTIEP